MIKKYVELEKENMKLGTKINELEIKCHKLEKENFKYLLEHTKYKILNYQNNKKIESLEYIIEKQKELIETLSSSKE